ncbi:2-succinyl-6-hydroxy-2,4-cyclohexadiene-1-carboxylate synthase [Mixta calida]|uniref:2-succinyl-6-hydroxy-2, 4-cyclohexadiene-1-carboxylate synthase n=1 Tax=Mixta calida TaxID=665913 RepID=UPI0028963965|nr:2-succinyl-6-hydroxy-2,4-cyclohexadiene-1-carboxylate synthase [Mixta calida]MBS6056974.1 2-succinyl-6-hydroxy-2,4-cyclohexadiene-1-carboxylate synthase [Pantoea sp.]MDU5192576.1 2-succinyl-6-hydroxy-2,4-cyclohexadiene-1-carboxylate synthase [Mixta calida]
MILHARWQGHRRSCKPTLVWLHGFLGSADDWLSVQQAFPDWPMLSIDLPGHGGSRSQRVSGFDALCEQLNATLRHHQIRKYWLIGYSMGGRVAMYYACRAALPGLCGLVVEAGHPGLSDERERQARLAHERRWIARFRDVPLTTTLEAWYRQPLFAELCARQRSELVAQRGAGHGPSLAAMLHATALSRQPNLLPELRELKVPFSYLCGEWDSKFLQLAQQARLPLHTIAAAGHNAHRASPVDFSLCLAQLLRQPV